MIQPKCGLPKDSGRIAMPKYVIRVFIGLLTAFALAAAPANAAPVLRSDQAPAAGALVMWSQSNFPGSFAVISEAAIPHQCAGVPFGTDRGALSVANATTGGVETVTEVRFFSAAGCAAGDQVAALRPGDADTDLGAVATHYLGVQVPRS